MNGHNTSLLARLGAYLLYSFLSVAIGIVLGAFGNYLHTAIILKYPINPPEFQYDHDSWATTDATVDIEAIYHKGGTYEGSNGRTMERESYYTYEFSYHYSLNGKTYKAKRCMLKSFDPFDCYKQFNQDDKITIFFQPEHPELATVYRKTDTLLELLFGKTTLVLVHLVIYLAIFLMLAMGVVFLSMPIVIVISSKFRNELLNA